MLNDLPTLAVLVLEGGGTLAEIWEREAENHRVLVRRISAEDWRDALFYPREQRNGKQAKRTAGEMARRVIEWSQATRPTSLRHDAAEAILIGMWGIVDAGWLDRVPPQTRR